MEKKQITAKHSSIAWVISFMLCHIASFFATIFITVGFAAKKLNTDKITSFVKGPVGYLILSLALYLVMFLIFLFFNKKYNIKTTQKPKITKLITYVLITATTFFALYPIIACINTLLVKCGFTLSELTYKLTTKNYIISLFSLVLAPAICEELLFRGVIFSGLKSHGKTFVITTTAIMFSIFHMSISQTVYPLLIGLLLGVIMFKEENIYYCIAIHLTNNFLSLTLSYFDINLIFNHWTYILLAIILFVAFLSIVLTATFKNNKNILKTKLDKENKSYLLLGFIIMILIWILTNLL